MGRLLVAILIFITPFAVAEIFTLMSRDATLAFFEQGLNNSPHFSSWRLGDCELVVAFQVN
jgi:hypothetical protein